MGKERSPAARSENGYTAKGVSKEILDRFVTAGLMVRSGDKSDPFYKFALDPIAEQLDANRLVIDIREDRADQTELDELVRRWDELPQDFVSALRRAGAKYGREICKSQNSLCAKLWPNEVIAQTPRIARRRARKNALRLKVRQCVIQDRHFTVEQVATATGIDLESIRTELARLLEERIVERILPASPRERSSIGAPAALYRLAKSEERIEALRQSIRKMQEAQSQMENLSGAAKALLSEILKDDRSDTKGVSFMLISETKGFYVPYLWDNHVHGALQIPMIDIATQLMAADELARKGALNRFPRSKMLQQYALSPEFVPIA
jgi:hypothetical protein